MCRARELKALRVAMCQACRLALRQGHWRTVVRSRGVERDWSRAKKRRLTSSPGAAMMPTMDSIDHIECFRTATLITGGLAHDLRNILGVVKLELETLEVQGFVTQPSLAAIREAVDRGVELTRRLMQFAGSEQGARQRVDLCSVIEGALGMLRSAAGPRASVVAEIAGSLIVEVDVLEIERVLLNLLLNACDALPEPRPVVILSYEMRGDEVGWTGLDRGRRYAIIAVRDSGEGMTETVRVRLFEPCFTTKGLGRGTGLGLASSCGIVRQHGGSMRVESSPGTGTTMLIALPLVQ